MQQSLVEAKQPFGTQSRSAPEHLNASAQQSGCAFDFPCNYLQVDSCRVIVRLRRRISSKEVLWAARMFCTSMHEEEKLDSVATELFFNFLNFFYSILHCLEGHKWAEIQLRLRL